MLDDAVLSNRAFRVVTAEFGSPPDISRLCENNATQLLRVPGLGILTLREIERWLAFYGKSIDKTRPRINANTIRAANAKVRNEIRAANIKARRDDIEKRRCPCCGHVRKKSK